MNSSTDQHPKKTAIRELIAIGLLLVAMAMGTGPGVLLVNRPETILGLPLIYAWGIFWFLMIALLSLLTDRFVWRYQSSADQDELHDRND